MDSQVNVDRDHIFWLFQSQMKKKKLFQQFRGNNVCKLLSLPLQVQSDGRLLDVVDDAWKKVSKEKREEKKSLFPVHFL